MTDVVTYEVVDGVAWMTIDRPEARNALREDVRDGLWDGTHRFVADDDAAVLVLTGAGDKAFCAGGDLEEMAQTALEIPPPDFLPQFGRNVEVRKPTIAAVNGVAFAGGFLLAQQCDLVVAAEHARFAVSEVKVGRGSPWAAPLSWLLRPRWRSRSCSPATRSTRTAPVRSVWSTTSSPPRSSAHTPRSWLAGSPGTPRSRCGPASGRPTCRRITR